MKYWKYLYVILAIALGAVLFIYAEIDDSPGGQLIGLLVALSGVVMLFRNKKKRN